MLFEREKLYVEVWAVPLTKLSMKYGMLDNGLRKVCKALNIPLPSVGHWAKIAAGHTIEPTPLPPEAERTSFWSSPPDEVMSFSDPGEQAWLKKLASFEAFAEQSVRRRSIA